MKIKNVQAAIRTVAPPLADRPVRYLDEAMDSTAFLIGDCYVFRFPKLARTASHLRREILLFPR